MMPTTSNSKRASSGYGRNRKTAVKAILEDAVKISKAARASDVVRFSARHFVVNVEEVRISIRAAYDLRLDAVSESKYLRTLLLSNPIHQPFGLDIWAPHKKVLNAEYDGRKIEIVSMHRGFWEDTLISAAKAISGPSGFLRIKPHVPNPSSQITSYPRQFDLVITEKQLAELHEFLLHDGRRSSDGH